MSDVRETLTPGRDAGFGKAEPPKPAPKKKATKDTKAAEPAADEE